MEKLGQAKTHLELKKMIAEVDLEGNGKNQNSPLKKKKNSLVSESF